MILEHATKQSPYKFWINFFHLTVYLWDVLGAGNAIQLKRTAHSQEVVQYELRSIVGEWFWWNIEGGHSIH